MSGERVDVLSSCFREAVASIDAGDIRALEQLLTANPALVRERLESPGAWLRDKVGNALDGFFHRPYLLWFVAEDPVRNGTLPENIGAGMLEAGADTNAPSAGLYSHGTPLHHAVSSGSLEAVRVLVQRGADLNAKDGAWGGAPLGWAEYYLSEGDAKRSDKQYAEIAHYLRGNA